MDGSSTFEQTVMEWIWHLGEAKPLSWWVEADAQFKGQLDSRGKSAMEQFMERTRAFGYFLVWFTAPHSLWLEPLPKSSLIIAGFSPEAGGREAATWLKSDLLPCLMRIRGMGPPSSLWLRAGNRGPPGLLDPGDASAFDFDDPSSVVFGYI